MEKNNKIYNDFPCIEDVFFNLIYIPLINKYNKVSGYAISNLSLKAKLLEFSYHQNIYFSVTSKIEKRYAVSNLGISMHEIVIGKKADEGYIIDHINGDVLFNTEENLRYATCQLNAQNKPKRSNTTSKYIGVSFNIGINKWVSKMNNPKTLHLGSFEDEIEAAKVYDIYTINHYKGQSPKTNDLLTKNEIDDIRCNGIPEKYKIKTRDLPRNISMTRSGTYSVIITSNGKKYDKTVKTLEAAILLKTQILEEIEENKKITKYTKKITRNTDGLAIIYMNNDLICLVEEDHWYDINQYKWNCYEKENTYSYPSGMVNGKTTKLHVYVYEKYVGAIPSNMTVDHIKSDNILDVRLKNLRLADRSLQNHNRDMSQNRIDKYKGIIFSTSGYTVIVNNCNYGTYKTAEEAAEKANEIYTKIYGNQATLNIIDYSKQTTKYNRIPEENITEEYIISLTKVCDVKNIITMKCLNTTNKDRLNNNKIILKNVKLETLDEYKRFIVDKLFLLIDK